MSHPGTAHLTLLLTLTLAATAASQAPSHFKLTAVGATSNDQFGDSGALSGDTAIIGANGFRKPGAAFVFKRSGTSWVQQAKLTLSNDPVDEFGVSVALDGDTALVGDSASTGVYVFGRSGTTWTRRARLSPSASGSTWFGVSVALDGNTALVGAPGSELVYVYVTATNNGAKSPA